MKNFIEKGTILSPEETATKEKILWVELDRPPIILGAPIKDLVGNDSEKITQLTTLYLSPRTNFNIFDVRRYKKEQYMIRYTAGKIHVALHKEASSVDILKAFFQAVYLRYDTEKRKMKREERRERKKERKQESEKARK